MDKSTRRGNEAERVKNVRIIMEAIFRSIEPQRIPSRRWRTNKSVARLSQASTFHEAKKLESSLQPLLRGNFEVRSVQFISKLGLLRYCRLEFCH